MDKNVFKNKKVLVTGCAGFIPSFVAQHFVENEAIVYGVDDLSSGCMENMEEFIKNDNFEFIKGDVCNKKLIESIIKKVDFVYHGAVRGVAVSVDNPVKELRVNTESTLIILEAIKKYGVERFVYPSSASVYGNQKKMPESEEDFTLPMSPYGASKLAAEKYCLTYHRLFNIPVVCLRYFNTYGPRQRRDSIYGGVISIFINNILQNEELRIYGDGQQTRDFTYIGDNLQATKRSFLAPGILGQVINIAGGREYQINDLANSIKKISGQKDIKINYIKKRIIDNIDRRYGDINLAKKLLAYVPATPLEEGLEKTYQWNKNLWK